MLSPLYLVVQPSSPPHVWAGISSVTLLPPAPMSVIERGLGGPACSKGLQFGPGYRPVSWRFLRETRQHLGVRGLEMRLATLDCAWGGA